MRAVSDQLQRPPQPMLSHLTQLRDSTPMSPRHDDTDDSPPLVTNRTMDIVVALLIIALASVFMFDSWRIGIGWIEGQGPAAGLLPVLGRADHGSGEPRQPRSRASRAEPDGDETFVIAHRASAASCWCWCRPRSTCC